MRAFTADSAKAELIHLWNKYDASSLLDLAFKMAVVSDQRDHTTNAIVVLDTILGAQDMPYSDTERHLIENLGKMIIEVWVGLYPPPLPPDPQL